MTRLLMVLPLLGGCWLANDFSRFERSDGGAHDLSVTMTDGASDAALGDASPAPSDMAIDCLAELAWTIVPPLGPPMTLIGATFVTVPQPNGNRTFLGGGCTTFAGGICGYSDTVYELAITPGGMGAVTFSSFANDSTFRELNAAGAPIPSATGLELAFVGGAPTQNNAVMNAQEEDVSVGTITSSMRPPFAGNHPTATAAAVLGATTWVVGGAAPNAPQTDTAYALPSATDAAWTVSSHKLNNPRSNAALAALGGTTPELWAIGGFGIGNAPLTSVETSASPASKDWTDDATLALKVGRYNHAAVSAPDGRIYVIGGQIADASMPSTVSNLLASVEVTCSHTFQVMTVKLPGDITNVSAAIGPDNRIYATGTTVANGGAMVSYHAAMYAYGPIVSISATPSVVTGTGFVPNQTVRVDDATGTTVGMGASDSSGTLGTGIVLFMQPSSGSAFFVYDAASHYPARAVVP